MTKHLILPFATTTIILLIAFILYLYKVTRLWRHFMMIVND